MDEMLKDFPKEHDDFEGQLSAREMLKKRRSDVEEVSERL